jgi:hypothetical protein
MDYQFLRSLGLKHIERLGSALWTDYNVHDPGITLLELLCYAITDLGFRASLPIADLLQDRADQPLDAGRQGFFTARDILTVNPLSVLDLRKALIDLPGVKNAWLQVLEQYPIEIYANCATSELQYTPQTEHLVVPRGLYDVQVEFENEVSVGDLGSGKVVYPIQFPGGTSAQYAGFIELRFPSHERLEAEPTTFAPLHSHTCTFTGVAGGLAAIVISGNETDAVDVDERDRANALKSVLFVSFGVTYEDPETGSGTLSLSNIPMRAWFHSEDARRAVTWEQLKLAIAESSVSGPIGLYHQATLRADQVLLLVQKRLSSQRNLCEDYARIRPVALQDVSVCLDMDVESTADIEAVVAQAYDRIDQYMSPDVEFRSLGELLEAGTRVEDIFDGPALSNGFLDDETVARTELKTLLHASDIIALLSDIDGVVGIRNFRMVGYDEKGHALPPAQAWELRIRPGRAPRFYPHASKFLVFKNGLPFLPDRSELRDVLQVVRGRRMRPKIENGRSDLPVPAGKHLDLAGYLPAQYELPRTYGVGREGLPPSAGVQRLARAKQLRGYLLFFEQLLVNYLEQLRHLPDLFAIDASVSKTKFVRLIDDGLIAGVTADFNRGLDHDVLRGLVEDETSYLERRNLFLDQLLARFAESFADFAVVLFQRLQDKAQGQRLLIDQKIAFLKELPEMTRNRARGFDYQAPPKECSPDALEAATNRAGLSLRVQRLLGLEPPKDEVLVVEHILLRPRSTTEPLLGVCLPEDCSTCGEEDPYSFRVTIVLSGDAEHNAEDIDFRRYAESAIRREVPAHLGVKVCWVSDAQLAAFKALWCAWLVERRRRPADDVALRSSLVALLGELGRLESVYPPAHLHDCVDGNDANRVYLDRTVLGRAKGESE